MFPQDLGNNVPERTRWGVGRVAINESRTKLSNHSLVDSSLKELWTRGRSWREGTTGTDVTHFPCALHWLCVLHDHSVDGSGLVLTQKAFVGTPSCKLWPHLCCTRGPVKGKDITRAEDAIKKKKKNPLKFLMIVKAAHFVMIILIGT